MFRTFPALIAAIALISQPGCRFKDEIPSGSGLDSPSVPTDSPLEQDSQETADTVDTSTDGLADADEDGWTVGDGDCNDDDPEIHPEAEELCNDIDDDCNGQIDDGLIENWYVDDDQDGFGNPNDYEETCDPDPDLVADGTDCDDGDPEIYPDADESCDGLDEDCDEVIDEDTLDGDWFYADDDDDGFGDPSTAVWSCDGTANDWDCDDTDVTVPQVVDAASSALTPDGSAEYPWPTIQEGIDAANQCVIVYSGFYYENLDFYGAGILVWGVDGADVTVVDGSAEATAVVTFNSGEGPDAELTGFTLTGGEGYPDYSEDTGNCDSASVESCVTYTWTWCGGGIYVDGSGPTLHDLILQENTLPQSSAWQNEGEDGWYYEYSYGGGICVRNSALAIDEVDLVDNFADQGGGAWIDANSDVDWTRSRVVGNGATDGGAFLVDGGDLSLTNVLSAFNEATGSGGGVLVHEGLISEVNVTHAYETSVGGGALQLEGTVTASILNTIIYGAINATGIAGEETVTLSALYNNVYGNENGEYEGVTNQTGTNGNISWDPMFLDVSHDGDLDNDDFGLDPLSLSVDGGYPAAAYRDVDGSTNDQGAYGGPEGDW
jgi:hypothetical protein